ncbi:MAG TPA: MgtC/SapB family protein [Blastocatellia bacterium]|nr:MgtC/SapB family protein [Blastocatellia bacterium]
MTALELHPEMLLRLVIAVVLGALIGFEREREGKPAGVRTHGMVALGAALFTLITLYGFGAGSDPTRVAAQIVTGIGFIGARAILQARGNVQGLTTAASLWVTAAAGMAVGVRMWGMSLATAVLVFLLLRFGPRSRPNPATGGMEHQNGLIGGSDEKDTPQERGDHEPLAVAKVLEK